MNACTSMLDSGHLFSAGRIRPLARSGIGGNQPAYWIITGYRILESYSVQVPIDTNTGNRQSVTPISCLAMLSSFLKPVVFISAAAVSLLGIVTFQSRKARYYVHLTLYLSALGFCSILGVVYSLTLSLVGQVSLRHMLND